VKVGTEGDRKQHCFIPDKMIRLSFFDKIGGMGRTDGWTDGHGATLNAAP